MENMKEIDFYKLNYDDMVDALLNIKLNLDLKYLTKQKILDLAFMFKHGYTPKGLIPYIISINNKERTQVEYDDKIFSFKFKRWLDEHPDYKRESDRLWEESQRIIDNKNNNNEKTINEEILIKEGNDMNITIISGNVVKDPEGAVTANGKVFSRFDLAVNEYFNGTQTTTYVKCSCWEKQAEFMNSRVRKGDNIICQGRLKNYEYTMANGQKRGGLELSVTVVEKARTKNEDNTTPFSYKEATNELNNEKEIPTDDIDVPF